MCPIRSLNCSGAFAVCLRDELIGMLGLPLAPLIGLQRFSWLCERGPAKSPPQGQRAKSLSCLADPYHPDVIPGTALLVKIS